MKSYQWYRKVRKGTFHAAYDGRQKTLCGRDLTSWVESAAADEGPLFAGVERATALSQCKHCRESVERVKRIEGNLRALDPFRGFRDEPKKEEIPYTPPPPSPEPFVPCTAPISLSSICGLKSIGDTELCLIHQPLSWKAEVIADNSGKWCGNALRFKTRKDAREYVEDLACRWTLVRETRVVADYDEQPNVKDRRAS